MSYEILPDEGKVEFTCHGFECGKKEKSKAISELPKNWLLTGILVSKVHDEFANEEEREKNNRDLIDANNSVCGHFCSVKCAKKTYARPEVLDTLRRLGLTVVGYQKTVVLYEGEDTRDDDDGPSGDSGDEPSGDGPPRKKIPMDDIGLVDDREDHIGQKKKGRADLRPKPKSPPPFQMGEGGPPI